MSKKISELKSIDPKGTGNLITAMLYYGIYENDNRFFNNSYGKNILYVFEAFTGITLNKLKEYTDLKNQDPLQYIAKSDLENYTVNELAEKYKTTPGRIRYYIRTHDVEFKRIYKKSARPV